MIQVSKIKYVTSIHTHADISCCNNSFFFFKNLTSFFIYRITGLDPAKPAIERTLKKGDAVLVDCVHTNPNGLGTDKAVCDIDFWVNYGCEIQPSCEKYSMPLTSSCMMETYFLTSFSKLRQKYQCNCKLLSILCDFMLYFIG